MVKHDLDQTDGILTVAPEGPLAAEDFAELMAEVDPYIECTGGLRGLLIETEAFPGWDGFGGLLAHLRFVRDHHRLIRRVAPPLHAAPTVSRPSGGRDTSRNAIMSITREEAPS